MLATEKRNPSAILRQNSAGDCSQCTKTWRTVGDVGSAKYGKSMVAKKRFRAIGDIRNVAKGHSTTIRIARKKIPAKAACSHLFHPSCSHRGQLLQASGHCLVKRRFNRGFHRKFHRRSNKIKGAATTIAKPPITTRDSLLHSCGSPSSGQTKSTAHAGTISRIGKGSGTICGMSWSTGPSLGCAGTSGNTHIRFNTTGE